MACYCWRHGLPAILLALVLVRSSQAVDEESKSTKEKQRTSSGSSSLQGDADIPDAPQKLRVHVSCKNKGFINWNYEVGTNGFLATICYEDEVQCLNQTIQPSARYYVFDLRKWGARYNISLRAYRRSTHRTIYSKPVTVQVSSFPEVPDMKSLTLTPLNNSAIQATWKGKWAREIKFLVCRTPKECEEHTVQGALLQHTFNGLAPNSAYTISAQAQVTLNKKTCAGTTQSHTARTFANNTPENLRVHVSCKNRGFISWNYQVDTDGFLATICSEDEVQCQNQTIQPSAKYYIFKLYNRDARYNISLRGYRILAHRTIYSKPATVQVSSYPVVPDMKSLTLTPLNNSAIQATWKEKWAGEIKFLVCRTSKECEEHTVQGALLQHTFNGLAPNSAYNISAQAEVTLNKKTCAGTAQSRTARTFANHPPESLRVHVSCKNRGFISWNYQVDTDGFLATMCYEDEVQCQNQAIQPSARYYIFELHKRGARCNISLRAYRRSTHRTIYSKPARVQVSSYPEVPDMKSLTLIPLNNSAIQAAWKEKWAGEIKFLVCRTSEECEEHTVQGALLQHTFNGLAPNSAYNISAQVQVTLNKKTCAGTAQSRTARTFANHTPENLRVHVSCKNRGFISWNYGVDTDGFLATICYEDELQCQNQTIQPSARYYIFELHKRGARCNVSLRAFWRSTHRTIYSKPARVQVSSYPEDSDIAPETTEQQTYHIEMARKSWNFSPACSMVYYVPDIKSLTLTPLNNSAIQATWKEKWAGEIKFLVCRTSKECEEHTVQGALLRHTFNGLAPNSAYNISAQAEVTLNKKTCAGTAQSRTERTFGNHTPKNLRVHVSSKNRGFISWNYQIDTDGFLLTICYEDEVLCRNQTVRPSARYYIFELHKRGARYNISLRAYWRSTHRTIYSEPATVQVLSYP